WGAPEFEYDYKMFANLGLDLGGGREAYAFGNFAKRKMEGGFYFRNPHTRGGVFEGPGATADGRTYVNRVVDGKLVRFWADDTGTMVPEGTVFGPSVKVADLSPGGIWDDQPCPPIRLNAEKTVANPEDIAAVEADPNCFSFISTFPGGFVPRFGGILTDYSAAFGFRGDLIGDWSFDASAVFGVNDVDFTMRHTINPQLLAKLPHGQRTEIPINYFPGSYTQTDYTVNFDVTRDMTIGDLPAHIAMGVEHRREKFKVESGDENSWFLDDSPGGLAQQGFGIGSNGFTGFGPRLAGEFGRNSYAAYGDVEIEVTDTFTFQVAGRYEDHADIGNTFDGKVAGRLDISETVSLRAAASTGFRAPTVGQANILNVTTAFTGGMLADEATLPPTHPAAAIVGAQPLTPEEAVNLTVGAVIQLDALDITVDYFNIEVEDRIARSSEKILTPANIQQLLAAGVADAQAFTAVRFYTNNFTTTTQGIDLVATYPLDFGMGETNLSLAANWTDTTVDERDPDVINDKRVTQLEGNTPSNRFTLSFSHSQDRWDLLARVRYYGGFEEFTLDDGSNYFDVDAATVVDVEVGYQFNDAVRLIVGAENILDEYPEERSNTSGLIWPDTSPFGYNGGYYYLRAVWDF
ncbi:MAG: TonB-dependent receptor, partial [Gammaproteobacteria bacterium]|nr:TonB-dependent receptor [Gammaproteobacteria bacterium]